MAVKKKPADVKEIEQSVDEAVEDARRSARLGTEVLEQLTRDSAEEQRRLEDAEAERWRAEEQGRLDAAKARFDKALQAAMDELAAASTLPIAMLIKAGAVGPESREFSRSYKLPRDEGTYEVTAILHVKTQQKE